VPWSNGKSHEQGNLICLCANCHQRADLEKWGEKTLREYKSKPWVMRQNNSHAQIYATKRIEMVIDMEIDAFDDHQENILRHALAGLLGISPQSICVRSKKSGSVKIVIDLPEAGAKFLLDQFKDNSSELARFLPSFRLLAVREQLDVSKMLQQAGVNLIATGANTVAAAVGGDSAVVTHKTLDLMLRELRPRLKQVLGRYRIPAHDAEDLVQEALVSTIQKWDVIRDPEAWLLVTLRNRCVVYWRKRRNSLYNSVDTAILELLSEPVAAPQERAELIWDLDNLLAELPPRCRKLLRLRYGLGYDSAEVAERMGYHPSSVRKVVRRCMAALTYQMVARGFSKVDPPGKKDGEDNSN